MTAEAVNNKYTTAVIGGKSLGPSHGWEAIEPKRTSKPEYLVKAQEAVQSAWSEYLWHIDAGADQGTLEGLWDDYDTAKRKCDQAWEAYQDGFDYEPIPF